MVVGDGRIKIREDRSREEERRFSKRVGLKGKTISQQPYHQFCDLLTTRIIEGLLLNWQLAVRTDCRTKERRHNLGRTNRIEQAEANLVDKLMCLLECADWISIHAPLCPALLDEFLFRHCFRFYLLIAGACRREFRSA